MHADKILSFFSLFLILGIVLLFSYGIGTAFAETKSFTVADNNFERVYIDLNQGDEIEYTVSVRGGANDDVGFTIYYPNGGNSDGGRVYESHHSKIVAGSSGTYVFEFDNTFSLVSNKAVKFSYEITHNTYYVYIDELPEWAHYANNVLYESTKYWTDANPRLNFYVTSPEEADFKVKWVKDFGQDHVGYAFGKMFIEVGLGDSVCRGIWHQYSSNHVTRIMTHEIGHVLGLDHNDNPTSIMYPYAPTTEYGLVEHEFTIREKQTQFVPLCSTKDATSYDYWISTDDPKYGFDVYFVPSINELERWAEGKSFKHYSDEDCFAEGYLSYRGTCEGISKDGGLLVIMNDELTNSLNTVTVKLQEISFTTGKMQTTKSIIHSYDTLSPAKPILQATQPPNTESVCGAGTILKDGICVVDTTTKPNEGGGCLIATATYGTELAPQVQQLRELRDSTFLQTNSGYTFMIGFNQLYYVFSPTIADLERENPIFKEVVKISITPLITSLSILNYFDMDSEAEVLGYGTSIILLNIGMYFTVPVFVIVKLKKKFLN